jgi:uncharacterized membrane protein
MLELAGPLAVAALVLAAGGAFKVRDPAPTRAMWAALGVGGPRSQSLLTLVSGVVELALGLATFLLGGWALGFATASAFTIFAVLAARLTQLPAVSCGCFGKHSGRTTRLHVVIDAVIAVVALVAALFDAPGFLGARPDLPGAGIAFVGFALLGAWFVVAALTVLPEALAAAERGPRTPAVPTFDITRTR